MTYQVNATIPIIIVTVPCVINAQHQTPLAYLHLESVHFWSWDMEQKLI